MTTRRCRPGGVVMSYERSGLEHGQQKEAAFKTLPDAWEEAE